MTPQQILDLARQIWPLPWQIDPSANPPVVYAEIGALGVAISTATPLVVIGTLGEEGFFEEETSNLPATLASLEQKFRRLVAVPPLT